MRRRLILIAAAALGALACSSRATESALYTRDADAVYRASLSAVAALSWEVKVSEHQAGFIQASVPWNARTFGSTVTIEIRRDGSDKSAVHVSSVSSQAIDWGRNRDNARNFLGKLDAIIGPRE
jgi:hypothetical protein